MASSIAGSSTRTGDSSTPSKSASSSSRSDSATTEAICRTWLRISTPERAEELLGQRPGGDPRRRLAGARALEHVADVGEAVLVEAGKVGMARAGQMGLLHLGVDRPRVHPLLPVRVVAVGDEDRHRAAQRLAVPDPRADLDRVLLDLHAPAAAVAELAASHVAVDPLAVELEARGQALDDRDEPRAVRFPGCREAKSTHAVERIGRRSLRAGQVSRTGRTRSRGCARSGCP